MKENKGILIRKEQGITLIALVITIIVLLILAGVSIAMLTGENGILTQAQKAKEETEKAQVDEENKLDDYENYMNSVAKENIVYKDDEGKIAIIPKGFYIVPGLDNINDGLVISDVENDIQNTGNQFVWVPVPEFSEFKRYDFQNDTEVSSEYVESTGNGIEDLTEAEKMYKSVKENKGFYIGRYEAGKDKTNPIKVVCQKGVDIYNKIPWGQSIIDETGGAVEKARSFNMQNGHVNVTSTLVYGVQWDAIMRWLSKGTEEERGWLVNSKEKGNYSGILNTKTGANDVYQMKHIYDLAGNQSEWTMEIHGTNTVYRGGGQGDQNNNIPCSYRGVDMPNSNYDDLGFRIALYL